jgi:hypothetical protein
VSRLRETFLSLLTDEWLRDDCATRLRFGHVHARLHGDPMRSSEEES